MQTKLQRHLRAGRQGKRQPFFISSVSTPTLLFQDTDMPWPATTAVPVPARHCRPIPARASPARLRQCASCGAARPACCRCCPARWWRPARPPGPPTAWTGGRTSRSHYRYVWIDWGWCLKGLSHDMNLAFDDMYG
jgi:hypothetical protein